jgi:3-isopropylmalate/(R)-2-methylmalate dehydratase large subunit
MGARGGIAPDQNDFLEEIVCSKEKQTVEYWKNIKTDADAIFDTELNIKAEDIEPMITYGTNPGMGLVFLKYSNGQPSSRWSRRT